MSSTVKEMSPLSSGPKPKSAADVHKFVIVGNPNVGKSVVFGRLANKYVNVSNYPGTTVTLTKGWMRRGDEPIPLIDTPGVNNLLPNSEEEIVTRNILLSLGECDRVIQVIDAKNLKRGLFLTLQLSEMGCCSMVALNMWDEAVMQGYTVDTRALEELFGVPFIPTIAIHNKGVQDLKKNECRHFHYQPKYHPVIEDAIERLTPLLPKTNMAPRPLALMALSGEESFGEFLSQRLPTMVLNEIREVCESTQRAMNMDLRTVIDKTRMAEAERITRQVLHRRVDPKRRPLWQGLEKLSTHRWGGFFLLCGVLWLMYKFVGELGAGTLVDLTETKLFNHTINPAVISGVDRILPFPHTHVVEDGVITPSHHLTGDLSVTQAIFRFVHDFFVGEYGAVTMALTYGFAIIFPVVVTFFLAFGLLEDLGYLPRLSILLNKLFRRIGLNGKAVLPMVLGLGCDTMATVTARILDTRKERLIVTFLLALAVPCSAQLAVIMFLLNDGVGASGLMIWGAVVLAVLFAAGKLAAMIIPGAENPLVLEIPPLRMPSLRNIVFKTLARVEWYLKEVIPIFLIGTAMLFFLNELRLLHVIEKFMEPLVVSWLGLPVQGADAILMGFFRRDYGAAGFIKMFQEGMLSKAQILVGMTTITLFVPCIANALIIFKEQGTRRGLFIMAITMVTAFGVGGLMARALSLWGAWG